MQAAAKATTSTTSRSPVLLHFTPSTNNCISEQVVRLLTTRHYSMNSAQKHRKPVSVNGREFAFSHVLNSSDLSTRFVLPFEGRPDAENLRRSN